jgi:hypothetical protein
MSCSLRSLDDILLARGGHIAENDDVTSEASPRR